jgi:hypothetical protein
MAITLGGAGGGSEINDQKFINSTANLITTESGEKWLKSGVTETSVASYPDASTVISSIANGSFNFTVTSAPKGIVAIGSDIWILYASSMQKFANTGGSALITISSLGGSETDARALGYDGTHLYVVGGQYNWVAKYTTAGVYTNLSFGTNPASAPRSAAWDGTYFHISNYANSTVYKFTQAGAYSGQSYGVQTSGCFLTVADGDIYALRPDSTIDKYSTGWSFKGSLSTSSFVSGILGNASNTGIAYDGSNFWITNTPNQRAYKFTTTKVVGLTSSLAEAGSPLYARIL